VQAIRVARQMKAVESGNGPNKQAILQRLSEQIPTVDDRVQCPYCPRKFAQQVAERHIPKCKNIINKPKPPPVKMTNNTYAASSAFAGVGGGPSKIAGGN